MTSFCSDRFQGFQHGTGRTDEELAAEIGVAPRTVHAWRDGRATPGPDDVRALAAALDIDIEDLAPTGQGVAWDYTSALALCAGPDPTDVLRELTRLLSAAERAEKTCSSAA